MEGLPFYEFEVNCYIMHISIATQVDSSVIVEEKAIFFYFFTFCKYSTFCVNCLFLLIVASSWWLGFHVLLCWKRFFTTLTVIRNQVLFFWIFFRKCSLNLWHYWGKHGCENYLTFCITVLTEKSNKTFKVFIRQCGFWGLFI